MNIAELVGRTLAQLGVGHAFGVVGSGNFDVTNALRRHGVPFVAARHEGGAATMADAYARMSGTVAVVTLHQGCGLTNAMTGITEAAKSRTPLIVLAADTSASDLRSNFRIDQDALARGVGAVAERVVSADTAVADTVRAYRTAVEQRRTVVLNLPLDVQASAAPDGTPASVPPLLAADLADDLADGFADAGADGLAPGVAPAGTVRPSEEAVRDLVELLLAAERPVFVAGRGARSARDEILRLAEHGGALVATSAVANGLFAGDPFSMGISGGFSSPLTAELIRGADLIVGWGCALNQWTMRRGALISEGTVVVQVDVEDDALGANRPIRLGVLGDAAATAGEALRALKNDRPQPMEKYRTESNMALIAGRSRWQDVPVDDISTADRIDPRLLSIVLDGMLPAERILAVDSGNFMGYPSTHLSVPDEFGFCFTQAFQSIGLGLATAIGAALARPDRLPVLGTGDGGFLMAISELETAVRLRLPLVVIVYNDAAYGAEVHHFTSAEDLSTVTFPDTDFAALARGYGADGLTVRGPDDLSAVRGWLEGPRTGPLVIDAKIANDGGSWWLAEAFAAH